MNTNFSLIVVIVVLFGATPLHAETPAEIYQRRVMPLLQSTNGNSCSECHLQGVHLSDFLTQDPKSSFASLRARGWIDTENPTQSKLLQFISKKPEQSTELMDRVRTAESEAIAAWIEAAVADPESLNIPLPKLDDLQLDEGLIQHARKDQIESRFIDIVWSQFERCANCHSPDRNAKQVEKNGDQMSWIVPNSPSETLKLLEERKLIDLDRPASSLLLTKALGQDDHGGGVKFPMDGQTDREWKSFLNDYSSIKQARYVSSKELPKFDSIRTWRNGLHLRIKDLPNLATGQYAFIRMTPILASGTLANETVAIGEGRVSKDGTSWSTTIMLVEPTTTRKGRKSVDWKSLMPDGQYQLEWVVADSATLTIEQLLAIPATKRTVLPSLWKTGHSAAKTILFADFK